MNAILDALQFRHACKQFDPDKKITPEQINTILECARLSPSSFGMEPWKFLVIESQAVKEKLRPACWNQAQITDASHIIVLLTTPAVIQPGHSYVKNKFFSRGLPEDATRAYIEKYKNHMEKEVFPRMSAYAWCSKQCYITLATMMAAAAAEGIDSCPMEGFEKMLVEKVLGIDTHHHEVAVVLALGFRLGAQTTRRRKPLAEIVEFI